MRREQIELRVQQAIENIRKGRKIEDSLIEAKSNWIDAYKAARRLAGHANATGGDWVLWIMGLDERTGKIVTPQPEELADWKNRLHSQFQGFPPTILQDCLFQLGGEQISALLFEATRRPYVVKVPPTESGNVVTHEVPWREGTSVRSARHEDLIRILVPQQSLPDIEILGVDLAAYEKDPSRPGDPVLKFTMRCYVTPRDERRIVFTQQRSHVRLGDLVCSAVTFGPVGNKQAQAQMLVWASHDGSAVIDGPGELYISLSLDAKRLIPKTSSFEIGVQLALAGSDRNNIGLSCYLAARTLDGGAIAAWHLDPTE